MPAYNVADYIDFGICNVVEHQFGNIPADQWELIVVDDGSTDDSYVIAQTWQQRYPGSITVIRTENRGVSAARNLGLDTARGTFVYFIDSDDILLRNSLIPLCKEAEIRDIDVVKFCFREIDTNTYQMLRANVPCANLTQEDLIEFSARSFVLQTNGLTGPPQHHQTPLSIYRRQFLYENSIRFNTAYSIGEDLIFTWETMLAKPRILYANRAFYLYHQRSNSAMHETDHSNLSKFGKAHVAYLTQMLKIGKTITDGDFDGPQVRRGLTENFRYGYNRALCSVVLGGDSLADIYRTMKVLKAHGGDVHPGRPRFDKRDRRGISVRNKVRRWIVAYILAPFA